jgi:hypothetical protein
VILSPEVFCTGTACFCRVLHPVATVADGSVLPLTVCLQEHTSALLSLKARIAEAGLQIPPELVVNGDLNATLYRFLRARKYNVQLAFAMLESESAPHALLDSFSAAVARHQIPARASAVVQHGSSSLHRPVSTATAQQPAAALPALSCAAALPSLFHQGLGPGIQNCIDRAQL